MAQTKKRQRELARAKEERRQAKAAAAQAKQQRWQRIGVIALVVAVVLGSTGGYLLLTLLGSDDEQASELPPELVESLNEAAQGEDDDHGGELAAGANPVAGCEQPGEMRATPLSFTEPGDALGGASAATLTLETNCGPIVIETLPTAAPETVNSMAFLAAEGYFSATICHRLTTAGIYVLQCGDPTATGSGGPGYSVPDENLPAEGQNNYPAGTVAMANAGPGTAGSQFFIVYEDTTLPSGYTIWGTVTSGLDRVQAIAAAGVIGGTSDGTPEQAVMIERVDVATG